MYTYWNWEQNRNGCWKCRVSLWLTSRLFSRLNLTIFHADIFVGTNNLEINKLTTITWGRNTIENIIMQCSYADKQNNLTHKAKKTNTFVFIILELRVEEKDFPFPMHEKLSKDYFSLYFVPLKLIYKMTKYLKTQKHLNYIHH